MPPKNREPQKDPKEQPKKTLQEACFDLKKAEVERLRERLRLADEAKRSAEYEELMVMIHGPPPYDPRTPFLPIEGRHMPERHLLELLGQTLVKHRRGLPRSITTARDYLDFALREGWVEVIETGYEGVELVVLASRAETQSRSGRNAA